MSQYTSSVHTTPRSHQRVSNATLPGSTSAPQTPKGRPSGRHVSRRQRVPSVTVPCYAGSKFSDSPSARAVPPPPTAWINEVYTSSSGNESDTSSVCESTSSASSTTSERSVSVASQSTMDAFSGVRLNPMQLIAAVTVGAS